MVCSIIKRDNKVDQRGLLSKGNIYLVKRV